VSTPIQDPTAVRTSVEVPAPADRAFEVFTAGIDRWWTRSHHVQSGELDEIGIDPFPGGRLWERNDAGEVCAWGRVLVWDPPRRLVHTWQLQGDWKYDADPAKASEIEILFIAEAPNRTRVEVTHRHLERHGDGAESVRRGVSDPKGWEYCLSLYAAAAGAA
jgi:uncharacterized protein YndB with AHSA1/START domain